MVVISKAHCNRLERPMHRASGVAERVSSKALPFVETARDMCTPELTCKPALYPRTETNIPDVSKQPQCGVVRESHGTQTSFESGQTSLHRQFSLPNGCATLFPD